MCLSVRRYRGPSHDGPGGAAARRTESNGSNEVRFQAGPGVPLLGQVVQGWTRILPLRAQGKPGGARIPAAGRRRRRKYSLVLFFCGSALMLPI